MVTLAVAVSPEDSEIILSDTLNGDARLPYRIVLDNEAMMITGIVGQRCVVHRAIGGSDPEAHAAGVTVRRAYIRYADTPTVAGTGEPGATGPAGPAGPVGGVGPQGPAGPTGQQGPAGPQGDPGPTGNVGPIGATGPGGSQGPKGDTGEQGPVGTGTPGATGPQGPIGPTGSQGPAGAAGQTGSTGATGNTGPQGPKGDDGTAGAQGSQGLQGIQGLTGPAGQQGVQGVKGDTGNTGPQGIPGTAGTDASIPTGIIAMWSGLINAIPSGWLLCNGLNGTPDLRDKFVKGAANGANPGGTGGAATHGHVSTQPADHPALTHSGATVGNHAFTQPGVHTDHAAQAHSAHAGATVANHADVLNHVHLEQLQGGTTGTTTGTHLMGSAAVGGSLRSAGQSTLNPTTGGVAAQVHTVGQASAHTDHPLLSHSAHSGGAVDAHAVGQASQHGVQAHSGAAVASASSEPAYYAIAFIMKA